jgi:hypothetical protein
LKAAQALINGLESRIRNAEQSFKLAVQEGDVVGINERLHNLEQFQETSVDKERVTQGLINGCYNRLEKLSESFAIGDDYSSENRDMIMALKKSFDSVKFTRVEKEK